MPSFPDVRLRQAGISAARVAQLRTAYDAMSPPQQAQFRAIVASRPDEILRRTYDPGGVPAAATTTADVVADPALLTAVQTAILAAHDTDLERETFIPTRLAATTLGVALVARPSLDKLPIPAYLAHRAGDYTAPAGTLEACRIAITQGADVLDLDCNLSADGVPIAIHDSTLDALTTGTGNVGAYNRVDLDAYPIDSFYFPGSAWAARAPRLTTIADIFTYFGHLICMKVEAKTTPVAQPLCDLIKKFGLVGSVYVECSSTAAADICRAAGIRFCFSGYDGAKTDAQNLVTIKAVAPWAYCQDITHLSLLQLVAQDGSVPRVEVATPERRVQRDQCLTAGVQHFVTPQYAYYKAGNAAMSTVARLDTGYVAHGWDCSGGTPTIIPGVGLEFAKTSSAMSLMLGNLGSLPAAFTLTGTIQPTIIPGDTSRHFDLRVCQQTDLAWNPANGVAANGSGYTCGIRANGQMFIAKDDGATSTILVTSSGYTALTAGQVIGYRIQVTATQVIFTRTDTNTTITLTDAAFRSGYFYLGQWASTTAPPGAWRALGSVTVA